MREEEFGGDGAAARFITNAENGRRQFLALRLEAEDAACGQACTKASQDGEKRVDEKRLSTQKRHEPFYDRFDVLSG